MTKKKTITLWDVPVDRALKVVELMKKEAEIALQNNEFTTVENLMYEINRILEAIDFFNDSYDIEEEA